MSKFKKIRMYIVLWIGVIVMVFPFVWMILCSFKSVSELNSIPIQYLPSNWNFNNYKEALATVPFPKMYWNTLLMIGGRVFCALLFSSMAAYGFARLNFPFKNFLFTIVIFQMMVPAQIFLIPQYQMLAAIGMLNSIFALIFPGLVSAFGTFLLRQSFMSLPVELEEAATLDGCNKGQIYTRILIPLVKPGLVSLAVFTALFSWKDLMWPLIVNMDLNKMPISSGLSVLKSIHITNEGILMAGSTMAFIPMLILYAICQKQFIEGIAQSGLKG
ncbi:MAG: carbohydrate ABC transporter permease [Eubacteriales bacterium]